MSIIKHEFYKVLNKKMLWFLVITLFFLNGFLYINRYYEKDTTDIKFYEELVKEYNKLPLDEALIKATISEDEYAALAHINFLVENKISEDSIKEQISKMLSVNCKITYDELIKKYENTPYLKDNDFLKKVNLNTYLIKNQLQYITSYPKFINSMEDKAKNMQSVSIFNKPNSFAFRNTVKTPKDFEKLKKISLKLGDERGIVNSTTFQFTDLFVIVCVFLFCIYIFSMEKENGLINLVKSNKKGRTPLILCKMTVLITGVILISILFYSSNLFLGEKLYGFGDTSRYVQSMCSFRDCSSLLTVKEYCYLFVITKVLASLVIAFIFSSLFILLSNSKTVYFIISAFFAVSYLAYRFIHPASYINIFKYINICYFFNPFKLYGDYANINVFGFPVSTLNANMVSIFIFLGLFLFISVYGYVKLYGNLEGGLTRFLKGLNFKNVKIKGSSSLFNQEAYKILIGGKGWIIIALAVLISYNNINFKHVLMDFDTVTYIDYIDAFPGRITEERKKEINKAEEEFNNMSKELNEFHDKFKKGQISENDYVTKINEVNSLGQKTKGFQRFKTQYEYLLRLEKEKGIQGSFINEESSDYIFNNKSRDFTNGITFSLLLILSLCNIFPVDYKKGMDKVLKSTPYGRIKLFFSKYALGYMITAFLMIIIYAPQYVKLLIRYNIEDWHAPIQSIFIFQNINMNISILGFVILATILQLLTSLSMATFILFISELIRRQAFTIAVTTPLFVFPFLMVLMKMPYVNFLSLTNGFTLYYSATKHGMVIEQIIYFSVLIIITILCTGLNVIKYNGVNIGKKKRANSKIYGVKVTK